MDDEGEEKICRYCFDGEESGELISPCNCMGGQKYVHLSCLRRWQRMVLVSQPTHPAFYDRDVRHHKCNVCQAEFTCAPPTRHELMESFTGSELGALIDVGCIIASDELVSQEMERELEPLSERQRERQGSRHWIRGVFLITQVTVDDGFVEIPVNWPTALETLRSRLDEDLGITIQGRRFRVSAGGSLTGTAEQDIPEAFRNLEASPTTTVCLESVEPPNCGDDHIAAVNLSRPRAEPLQPDVVRNAMHEVGTKYPGARHVQVEHYIGGPCDSDEIVCCVVTGGGGRGWTVVKELRDAIQLAHSRAARRSSAQGDIAGGQAVRVKGLKARPDLNGEVGMALRFLEGAERWLVRLAGGDGKQIKPANLEPIGSSTGKVMVFWGDARWSRTQLLGEIARGHWGLCRASISELLASPSERWPSLRGRLAFAPVTEMTENFLQQARREMTALRAAREAQGEHGDDEGSEEEEIVGRLSTRD